MIKNMEQSKEAGILQAADMMVCAALTAPKGSGKDTIRASVVTGEEKDKLRDKMLALAEAYGMPNFARDAGNVDNAQAVVLIGCTGTYFGMSNCGICGFEDCGQSDLGIAVGSAVSKAADMRIDNRVMYTAGKAALKLGFITDDTAICYGIPLSVSNKSIFFDRGPGAVINLK